MQRGVAASRLTNHSSASAASSAQRTRRTAVRERRASGRSGSSCGDRVVAAGGRRRPGRRRASFYRVARAVAGPPVSPAAAARASLPPLARTSRDRADARTRHRHPSARHDELPVVQRLARVIWRAHYPGIITREQIDYMLARGYAIEALAEFLGVPDRGLELALVDGEPVGFRRVVPAPTIPREAKLDKLYVLQSRQRRGLGGRLIARVAEHARARRARDADPQRQQAQRAGDPRLRAARLRDPRGGRRRHRRRIRDGRLRDGRNLTAPPCRAAGDSLRWPASCRTRCTSTTTTRARCARSRRSTPAARSGSTPAGRRSTTTSTSATTARSCSRTC